MNRTDVRTTTPGRTPPMARRSQRRDRRQAATPSRDRATDDERAVPADEAMPIERATYARGDYGRVASIDGTAQWWIRSPGGWIALTHQRVVENDDGTITLLYLR